MQSMLKAVTALCCVMATRATGQVALHVVARSEAEFSQPFNYVNGVFELAPGKLVVADAGENQLWLVTLTPPGRTAVGKQGTGPLDYLNLLALTNAGTQGLITDMKSQRYLVLDGQGKPVEAFAPAALGVAFEMMGLPTPKGIDAQGRIYMEGSPFHRNGATAEVRDSVPILRIRRSGGKVDTMGFIPVSRGDAVATVFPGGGSSIMTGIGNPFAARDLWTVAPDGRVAVVRAMPYRVEWISPAGTRLVGPVIETRPVPVTDADKTEYGKKPHMGAGAVTSSGADGQPAVSGRNDWPAMKPPFLANAVAADRAGRIWVLRSTAAGDSHVRYDLFGRDGRLQSRLELPEGTRVVGFGAAVVYGMRKDADGAERLGVFKVP